MKINFLNKLPKVKNNYWKLRFAIIPTKLTDSSWIWWEWYQSYYESLGSYALGGAICTDYVSLKERFTNNN